MPKANKPCACGCGGQFSPYHRDGYYYVNKSHWIKMKNKKRETEQKAKEDIAKVG